MRILANVQGIVAQSSSRPLVTILLFRSPERSAASRFVGEWLRLVPGGLSQPSDEMPVLHFAFSWFALSQLLENYQGLEIAVGRKQLEWAFTDPEQAPDQPALSEQLGFAGASDPRHWWEKSFRSSDIHLALFAYFNSSAQKSHWLERVRTSAQDCGLSELQLSTFEDKALSGFRPSNGRLHFGYRDGVTSPNVNWTDASARPPLVDLREFVVGYPNDSFPVSPQQPGPWQDFARDGSYVGLTWIYQDVARFNSFLRTYAPLLVESSGEADPRELLAAKLMGRWRDGSPLALYPDRAPSEPQLRDDFSYGDDAVGLKCPLNAHIRIANGRDQELSFANQSRFPEGPPRLIRRGFSYGEPLEGEEDDGQDRGLVGAFFCARLNEQLYTVMRWMQKTEFSEVFAALPNGFRAQDLLLGSRAKRNANIEAYLPRTGNDAVRLQLQDFIRYKGVVPLFMPGLRSLEVLSSGT